MIRFVLDTNTASDAMNGREPLAARVTAAAGEIAITVVTLEESLSGWYRLLRQAKRPEDVVRTYERLIRTTIFLAGFPILPLTLSALDAAERLRKARLNVGGDDLRIAAIAMEAGAAVVTANVRDFTRVPGLTVEDWTQPVP